MESTIIEKKIELGIQESFFTVLSCIHTNLFFKIGNKLSTSQTSLPKKMSSLADHRVQRDSAKYTESILGFYLFGDRIISSAKCVHICWIIYLYVFALNLPYSSVYFRLKQPKLVKSDIHPFQCETQIRYASSR